MDAELRKSGGGTPEEVLAHMHRRLRAGEGLEPLHWARVRLPKRGHPWGKGCQNRKGSGTWWRIVPPYHPKEEPNGAAWLQHRWLGSDLGSIGLAPCKNDPSSAHSFWNNVSHRLWFTPAELLEWLAEQPGLVIELAPAREPCEECDGTGQWELQADPVDPLHGWPEPELVSCEACGGSGWAPPAEGAE